MTANTDTPIICRTLRQLDALVAERVFGWQWWLNIDNGNYMLFPPECRPMSPLMNERWTPGTPDFASYRFDWIHTLPHYTTWAMLGVVVAQIEAAGYWVSMEGACAMGMNPDEPDAAVHPMGSTEESGYATGPTIPVAMCLAALAAFGCRVKLELGGES